MPRPLTWTIVLLALLAAVVFGAAVTFVFGVPQYLHSRRVSPVRPRLLRETMGAAEPLIQAIARYHAEHGRPPPTLESLVPKYIRAVPQPGRLAKDGWHYAVGEKSMSGSWALTIHVRKEYASSRWSFGDVFAYHPSGKYARSDYGGMLERIGRWGYYHE